jgi:hypothetical protein
MIGRGRGDLGLGGIGGKQGEYHSHEHFFINRSAEPHAGHFIYKRIIAKLLYEPEAHKNAIFRRTVQ